jgi:hypothetical protein
MEQRVVLQREPLEATRFLVLSQQLAEVEEEAKTLPQQTAVQVVVAVVLIRLLLDQPLQLVREITAELVQIIQVVTTGQVAEVAVLTP